MAPSIASTNLKRKRATTTTTATTATTATTEQPTTTKRRRSAISSSSEPANPTRKRTLRTRTKHTQREEIVEEDEEGYLVQSTVGGRIIENWIHKDDIDDELVAAWDQGTSPEVTAAPALKRSRSKKNTTTRPPTIQATRPKNQGRPRKEEITAQTAKGNPTRRVTRRSARNSSDKFTYPPASISPANRSRSVSPAISQPGRFAVQVNVVPRSSFDPQQFEKYSQLPESQEPTSASVQATEPASSPPPPTHSFLELGIVPNSQSSKGSVSYNPTTQDASGSKQLNSTGSASYASYVPTSQEASGSNQKQTSNESGSYIPTTQEASGSTQHISNSSASYILTTGDASGTSQQQNTYTADDNSGELEEQASAPSPSVPETDPVESQSSPQREIPDTFETTKTRQNSGQSGAAYFAAISRQTDLLQDPLTKLTHNSGALSQPSSNPELTSPSQSLLQIEESEIVDSIIETEPPSQPELQSVELQSVDESELVDSIVEHSSPALNRLATSSQILQSVYDSENLDSIVETFASPEVKGGGDFASGTDSENSGLPLARLPLLEPEPEPQPQPTNATVVTPNQTQHAAQVIPVDLILSTQSDSAYSVRPSTIGVQGDPVTPSSRHDSSQQSPSPLGPSASVGGYSPLPRPPTHSIGSLISNVPPSRPKTPIDVSSLSTTSMADDEAAKAKIAKAVDELLAKGMAEKPFVPKRRNLNLTHSPSATGTRSPSTIPDRSPVKQVPTSLRTAALAAPEASTPDLVTADDSVVSPVPAPVPNLGASAVTPTAQSSIGIPVSTASAPAPPISTRAPIFSPAPITDAALVSAAPSVTSEPMDEDDDGSDSDDSESLLNDDLGLSSAEHIVPLSMEGRQRSMYMHELDRCQSTIKTFMNEPQTFTEISKVEKLMEKLRAIETHMDLTFAEAAGASRATAPSTQAQWDTANCVKFKFLGQLFRTLQDHDMHIVVVVDMDDERIFDILEKFCKAKFIHYRIPAMAHQSNPLEGEGSLIVTFLSSDSRPVILPPTAIICLDGTVTAVQIRKMSWSVNPDRHVVPIIHLVVPRSVGHIERYINPAIDSKKRLHTICCSLAQVYDSIGRPMVESPIATKAAELVAEYLFCLDQDDADAQAEWLLPSVGSIKDLIEYQSQQSQEHISSPPPIASASYKRPLEAEQLDPAKRRRMTPQACSSIANQEVTHISDSMPGTAAQFSKLQEQLLEAQADLKAKDKRHQAELKASEKKFREHQVTWDKRQLEYEDLRKKHRTLLGEVETSKKSLEAANKSRDSANERYNKKMTEMDELLMLFTQLQTANLASDDEKTAEITRLQKELIESKAAESRAINNARTQERTLDYVREQYQTATDTAIKTQKMNEVLGSELTVANKKAAGQAVELKKTFQKKSFDTLSSNFEQAKIQNKMLKEQLQCKEDEIARMKTAKEARMNTRGQSVGPRTPRPGSRAASPQGRDRLANLRNG